MQQEDRAPVATADRRIALQVVDDAVAVQHGRRDFDTEEDRPDVRVERQIVAQIADAPQKDAGHDEPRALGNGGIARGVTIDAAQVERCRRTVDRARRGDAILQRLGETDEFLVAGETQAAPAYEIAEQREGVERFALADRRLRASGLLVVEHGERDLAGGEVDRLPGCIAPSEPRPQGGDVGTQLLAACGILDLAQRLFGAAQRFCRKILGAAREAPPRDLEPLRCPQGHRELAIEHAPQRGQCGVGIQLEPDPEVLDGREVQHRRKVIAGEQLPCGLVHRLAQDDEREADVAHDLHAVAIADHVRDAACAPNVVGLDELPDDRDQRPVEVAVDRHDAQVLVGRDAVEYGALHQRDRVDVGKLVLRPRRKGGELRTQLVVQLDESAVALLRVGAAAQPAPQRTDLVGPAADG